MHITTSSRQPARVIDRRVALVPLLLLALVLLKAAIFSSSGILDTDFWWHTEYARFFFKHWRIAETDWLTWTHEGKPYLVTQWLGQVLVGAPYFLGGLAASSAATALVSGAVVFFSWRTALLFIRHQVVAFIVALFTTLPIWTIVARPQMYGMLACSALVWLVSLWQERGDRRTLFAIPVLLALWVNLHGSYVVGLIYIAVVLGASALGAVISKNAPWRDLLREHAPLAASSAAALIATLANPHGVQAWEYVVTVSRLQTTTSGIIIEWLPTSGKPFIGQLFLAVVAAAICALATARQRPAIKHLFVFLWAFLFGLSAVRQVYFATLAMTPILAALARTTPLGELFEAQISRDVKALTAAAVIAGTSILCWPLYKETQDSSQRFSRKVFPHEAMRFLEQNHVHGRLFNEYTVGGWTVANTQYKPSIDGRLDLFGDEFFFGWYFARNGFPGWKEFLAKHDPQIVVLQNNAPLRQLLVLDDGFSLVYKDSSYSVLVKREAEFQQLINVHERKPAGFTAFDSNGRIRISSKGW
jgi:hypothetical protein